MNIKTGKTVIFADLDGSLLNDKYQYTEIAQTLRWLLEEQKVALVFASSKTRSEILFYKEKLDNRDPFIVENGSAIFIPKNYFQNRFDSSKQTLDYDIIELGASYEAVRKKLNEVKLQTGATILGFGDMRVEDVAKDAGLPLPLATLAKKREYSEPFKIIGNSEQAVFEALNKLGLCFTRGGRYFHALGGCNKGKATAILKDLFLDNYSDVYTIGVGNSENDLAMLRNVDAPFYIKNDAEIRVVWEKVKALVEKHGSEATP